MTDFIRGFFWIEPAPYHAAFRRWSAGQATSICLALSMVPIAIFVGGFVAGFYFR